MRVEQYNVCFYAGEDEPAYRLFGDDGKTEALVLVHGPFVSSYEPWTHKEAQDALKLANKMAAAVGLYEACKMLEDIVNNILTDSQLDVRTQCGQTVRRYSQRLQAAIAKAEGRNGEICA